MTFDEYQKLALNTAARKGQDIEFAHRVLGLVGEAGEIAEKTKKIYPSGGAASSCRRSARAAAGAHR